MKYWLLILMVALAVFSANVQQSFAAPSIGQHLFASPDGQGNDCTQAHPCTLHTALEKLHEGEDALYLAAGRYTGEYGCSNAVIAVFHNDVRIIGGWDGAPTGRIVINPALNPVVIDGEDQHRGIYVSRVHDVVIQGLQVVHGNATGLGSDWGRFDAGGGLYARNVGDLTIRNCVFKNNVASKEGYGMGGGLALYRGDARLIDVRVVSNDASTAPTGYGYGGGIFSRQTSLSLDRVVIQGNIASQHAWGYGGGVYLTRVNGRMADGKIIGNVASAESTGFGGGVLVDEPSDGMSIRNNVIRANLAGGGHRGEGGGVFCANGAVATLRNNLIIGNTATHLGLFMGAGVAVVRDSMVALVRNKIVDNDLCETCPPMSAHAGGVEATESVVGLLANEIRNNDSAGVGMGPGMDVKLINNLVARNVSSGLLLEGAHDQQVTARISNNTLADNGASGILLSRYVTLTMTNTLISGHVNGAAVRSQDHSNQVNAAYTLLYGNAEEMTGPGAWNASHTITGQPPRYRMPEAGDYHLNEDSPAVDSGVFVADVGDDIDGEPRPNGSAFDIGADEYWPSISYMPLVHY